MRGVFIQKGRGFFFSEDEDRPWIGGGIHRIARAHAQIRPNRAGASAGRRSQGEGFWLPDRAPVTVRQALAGG